MAWSSFEAFRVTALASGLMAFRRAQRVIGIGPGIVNKLESAPANQVKIPLAQASSPHAAAESVSPRSTAADPNEPSVTLDLDQYREADFQIRDKDRNTSNSRDAIRLRSMAAAAGLADELGQYVLALALRVPALSVIESTVTVGFDTFIKIRSAINKAGMSRFNRDMFLGDVLETKVLSIGNLQEADKRGDAQVQREGVIGRVFGINLMGNQPGVAQHTAVLTASTTFAAAAADQNIVKPLATWAVGDTFKFLAAGPYYSIIAGSGVANTNATLNRDLSAAIASNATPNKVLAKSEHSLVVGTDAIGFGMAPLSSEATALDTMIDPETGLSLAVELARGQNLDIVTFRALYGATLMAPEQAHAVILEVA